MFALQTTGLPEFAQEPVVLAALTIVLILAAYYQRTLSYREYRTAHLLRVVAFSAIESSGRVDFRLTAEKGMPDDEDEFVTTSSLSIREVFGRLRKAGASPHLISGVKYREHPDRGREYAAAHLIFSDQESDKQTEVWLFPAAEESGTDIYAHKETHVTDPEGHLSDPYEPGDPDEHVKEALA